MADIDIGRLRKLLAKLDDDDATDSFDVADEIIKSLPALLDAYTAQAERIAGLEQSVKALSAQHREKAASLRADPIKAEPNSYMTMYEDWARIHDQAAEMLDAVLASLPEGGAT